jgi:hypothetical protein
MENMEKAPPPPHSPSQIWKEFLAILDEEELIRFQVRFHRKGLKSLARLLEVERNKRGS